MHQLAQHLSTRPTSTNSPNIHQLAQHPPTRPNFINSANLHQFCQPPSNSANLHLTLPTSINSARIHHSTSNDSTRVYVTEVSTAGQVDHLQQGKKLNALERRNPSMADSEPTSEDSSTEFFFDGCDVQTASPETIVSLLDQCPVTHQLHSTEVMRISQKLVIKSGHHVLPSEAENMRFVAANTSVRLPKVHRYFSAYKQGFIIMDYIEGVCLADCWNELDSSKRQNVISQVAGMIQQLQSVQLDTPGPIGGGPSRGILFSDYGAGPFTTRQDIEHWFNYKLAVCKKFGHAKQDAPSFNFPVFVFAHLDIAPRHLILDPSDQIWIIDWAFAGAYPPCLEAASLQWYDGFQDFNQRLLAQLHPDPQDMAQIKSIRWGLISGFFAKLNPEDPSPVYQ